MKGNWHGVSVAAEYFRRSVLKGSARGAILVHVAIMMVALLIFVGVAMDLGVAYVGRGQAQNAADAAALAGGWARIISDPHPSPSTTTGIVHDTIVATANRNSVWGQAPTNTTVDMGWGCPTGGTTNCVRVDVHRSSATGNPITTYLMPLANVNTQNTRARAISRLMPANATGCLRPWFLIDRYTDTNGNGQYDAGDTYVSPGYDLPTHLGASITLHDNLSPSGYGQIDVGAGTNDVRDAIRYCVSGGDYYIGQTVDATPGNKAGQRHGMDDLLSWDPTASWDGTRVVNSCAESASCSCGGQTCANGGMVSPRVATIAVCSPTEASCATGGPANSTIVITNLLSIFIESYTFNAGNLTIYARIIGTGGHIRPGAGAPPSTAAFLGTPVLIR